MGNGEKPDLKGRRKRRRKKKTVLEKDCERDARKERKKKPKAVSVRNKSIINRMIKGAEKNVCIRAYNAAPWSWEKKRRRTKEEWKKNSFVTAHVG